MATGRNKPDMFDVAIIGGGAAGLATSIFVSRRMPDCNVAILDGATKLGAKILVSGGGRCNVTNRRVTARDFWGGSSNIVKRVLGAFSVDETIAFFAELGVTLHEEPHGKLFPDSNRARSVVDSLLREVRRLDVRLLTSHRVTRVRRNDDDFGIDVHVSPAAEVDEPGDMTLHSRCVVLATGGKSLPKTGSDGAGYAIASALGHSIVSTTPALAPLVLGGRLHAALSGISQEVELTIRAEGDKPVVLGGAMLWTHFGLSGPVVLNASRHWHRAHEEGRGVSVSINFLPGNDLAAADARLVAMATLHARTQVHNVLSEWLPARVAEALLASIGVGGHVPMGQMTKAARRKLAQTLTAMPIEVRSSRGYGYAEVTAGGIPLTEIDSRTMASRKCPGLFLVGEILDVDGRIGGFNFQWAWSGAYVAAQGIATLFEE